MTDPTDERSIKDSHPYRGFGYPFPINRHPYRTALSLQGRRLRSTVFSLAKQLDQLDPATLKKPQKIIELNQSGGMNMIECLDEVQENSDRSAPAIDPPSWRAIEHVIDETKGSNCEHVIIFPIEEWKGRILTPKRVELLDTLRTNRLGSISELSKLLARSRPNVTNDLHLLEHYGLVELHEEGRRTVPVAIATEIRIIADTTAP